MTSSERLELEIDFLQKKGSSGEFVGESVRVNPPAPRGGLRPVSL